MIIDPLQKYFAGELLFCFNFGIFENYVELLKSDILNLGHNNILTFEADQKISMAWF